MMRIKIIIGCILGSIGLVSFFLWHAFLPKEREMKEAAPIVALESAIVTVPPTDTFEPITEEEVSLPTLFLIPDVPFTVQAPSAEWNDPMFQDACEEASIIMAQAWLSGKPLTKESTKKDIVGLVEYQKKIFGHAVDTSIQDTSRLLSDYFSATTSEVRRGITLADMRRVLASEKLIIVPTDGRKLRNPNFKQPGPPRHMLVIIGYDTVTEEFIVNDPGTRKGEKYRYQENILYDAILDYPTGEHVPVMSTDKVMLVVWRG